MSDALSMKDIENRLITAYENTDNKEQQKGVLKAAQNIARSELFRETIRTEAKAHKLKRKLDNLQSDLTYKEHSRIKELIENRKLEQAELALPQHL